MNNRNLIATVLVSSAIFVVPASYAKPTTTPTNVGAGDANGCQLTDVKVTNAVLVTNATNPSVPTYGSGLSATACIGPYGGNDLGTSKPGDGTTLDAANIGISGNGLFNGAPATAADVLFDPGAFIGEVTRPDGTTIDTGLKTLGDVNGDGVEDPGWIFIGAIEGTSFVPATILGQSIIGSDFFSCTATGGGSCLGAKNGTWTINPNADDPYEFLDALAAVGVTNIGFFDAFAINLKAGQDQNGGGFSSYLFTADTLGLPVYTEDLFSFSGTFTTAGLANKDLSHISLWIHDPVATSSPPPPIPEPSVLALLGAGLFGFARARRRVA